MDDNKSLTVVFAVLKAFNILKHCYGIEIE